MILNPKEPLVQTWNVNKTFGEGDIATKVLFDVCFTLNPGELTLLMGPSGSGKTTLISIAAGVLSPSSGTVHLCGTDITHCSQDVAARVRREHVGFVFQQYHLFPALSAFDNVAEVLRLKGWARAEARERAEEALALVGLTDRATHLPRELSGGQQQRVAIARALAGRPRLLVGDEVTGALDSQTAGNVMELVRGFVNEERSALIVTHDHRLRAFADRVVSMEDGRIVSDERL